MGIFQDLNDLSTPWRFSADEWKNKVENSNFGSPIHGLRAGYEMTKLGSAYRLKQGINRINDGQNPFSSEFIRGTANDQGNNVASAVKENWPVMLAMLGGYFGGGDSAAADTGGESGLSTEAITNGTADLSAAGDLSSLGEGVNSASSLNSGLGSSSGILGSVGNYGKAASSGASLLSQKNQQPQAAPSAPPPQQDQQAMQRARMKMAMEQQRQALLMKPNKTLQDYLQLSQLRNQQGLLGQQ